MNSQLLDRRGHTPLVVAMDETEGGPGLACHCCRLHHAHVRCSVLDDLLSFPLVPSAAIGDA